jgi:hypothetical protein
MLTKLRIAIVLVWSLATLSGCEFFLPRTVSPKVEITIVNPVTPPPVINLTLPTNFEDPDLNVVDLPVCYLQNCVGMTNDECAARAHASLINTASPVWSFLQRKPEMIVAVGEQHFYVQSIRKVTLDNLARKWSELGCTGKPEEGGDARFRQCVRYMPDWVRYANSDNKTILDLGAVLRFRETCMRISPFG